MHDMMDKIQLRGEMRARRRALPAMEQEAAAQAVLARLEAFAPFWQAQTVMAYMACGGELSLAPAIGAILKSGKALALPRCGAAGEMTARRVRSLSQLAPGAYGILEPGEACEAIAPRQIDLILVPGTAFDRRGGRLGQGGGYYDRFMKKTQAMRVGVCHGFALLERVPAQAHDLSMDAVITPQETIWIGGRA